MTRGRRTAAATLVLALSLIALTETRSIASRPAGGDGHSPGTERAVDRIVLPNGLTVLLVVDHRAPLVGMELRYRVGRRDDPAGRPGLTYLVQNLMVRSTAHLREGDYARYFETAGASDSQWFVNHDRTLFRITVPSGQLALPLWMWSDQMGFFADGVDAPAIAAELATAQHHWSDSRVSPRNNGIVDLISAELYPPGDPYRMDVFPDPGALQSVSAAELRGFVQAHYGPEHAILTLMGNFDSWRARELVERYFGTLRSASRVGAPAPPAPPLPPPLRRSSTLPSLVGEIRLQIAEPVDFPTVTIAWPTVPIYEPGDAELDLIAESLVGRHVGWLYSKLVDKMKIASSVWAHQYSRALGSEFLISATATRGHTAGELVEAIDQVLRDLQSKAPPDRTVAGALTGYLFDKVLGFEHYTVSAEFYGNCEEFTIGGGCFSFHTSRYTSLDSARLYAVTRSALPLGRRVVVEVTPAPDAPATGRLLGRSVVPE